MIRVLVGSTLRPSTACPAANVRWGHTVRLIAVQDLPHGKAYKDDVVRVRAGYARNFLVPQKMAVYATPKNFERLGLVDPDVETEEQRLARLAKQTSYDAKEEKYLKEADLLRHYLRNKVLKIWRVVDANTQDTLHPGKVNAWNIRHKLSKQLKIDLEDHEKVHIYSKDPVVHSELTERKMDEMMTEIDTSSDCSIEIKRLGDYLVRISLDGGHAVPLRVNVLRRMP